MVGLDNPLHLAFLLVVVLLLFGAKRLPEMGRSLGTGMRSFKESISGESASDTPAPLTVASSEPPVSGVIQTGSFPVPEVECASPTQKEYFA